MKRRILSLVLAILMVMPLLVACSDKEGKESAIDIVADGVSDYTIVYSNNKSATVEKAAADALRTAIQEATGVKLDAKNDWMPSNMTPPATAKEILIGETNRTESKNALALVRAKDFVITYENERVVITGGNADATRRAVDHFIANYIKKDDAKVTVISNKQDMVRFDYMLGDVSIDGVSIKEYTVVYPEGADLVTYYLAHNISDYFLTNAGYALNVTSDKATAQKYEILVGSTNRSEDDAAVAMALGDDQYVLCKNGDKIVMWGKSYMVGGAASALVNTFVQSAGVNTDVNVTSLPASPAAATFSFKKATSAILMIGDGMGFNHILSAGAIGMTEFVADRLPSTSCTTHSQSVINNQAEFTDSAAAATALATGYKTINGFIGVDAAGVNRQNVRELAHATGARTAVITTDVITGATPAGFLCHSGSRNDTSILQSQIDDLIKTGGVNYAVGGFKEKELTDYAREALSVISENGSDYFIMIEEAHIDKHSHKNTLSDVQLAVTYYNDAIAYVIGFVMMHPDTALIVTADHECGKMYIDQDTGAFRFDSDDHSNTQVPFYAIGGGTAELLASAPVLDNTMVAKFIAEIFGANSFGQ